jgi:hypothetical protein
MVDPKKEEEPRGPAPVVEIHFHSEESPLWPELEEPANNERILETTVMRVGVVPGAMRTGAPVVSLRADVVNGDGTPGPILLVHTSMAAFLTLCRAIKGRLEFLGVDEFGQKVTPNGPKENLD